MMNRCKVENEWGWFCFLSFFLCDTVYWKNAVVKEKQQVLRVFITLLKAIHPFFLSVLFLSSKQQNLISDILFHYFVCFFFHHSCHFNFFKFSNKLVWVAFIVAQDFDHRSQKWKNIFKKRSRIKLDIWFCSR